MNEPQEEGWPLPVDDTTNGMNGGVSPDLAVIARYMRKVNGQILVTSELSKGSIFTIELQFEHAALGDVSRPRKLRNLFLPTPGLPEGHSLPKCQPSMKSSNGRKSIEIQRKAEITPKTDGSSPPPNNGQNGTTAAYDHMLSIYGAPGEITSPHATTISRNRSQFQLNVLVAEDGSIILRMLDEKLSLLGHQVDITSNGQECHSQFASN